MYKNYAILYVYKVVKVDLDLVDRGKFIIGTSTNRLGSSPSL